MIIVIIDLISGIQSFVRPYNDNYVERHNADFFGNEKDEYESKSAILIVEVWLCDRSISFLQLLCGSSAIDTVHTNIVHLYFTHPKINFARVT